MLSNKTYRFISVILTLREGKRGVSVIYVPTEVNSRSNERQEHLRNLVLFYIGASQNKRNELLNQLRKKEMCV